MNGLKIIVATHKPYWMPTDPAYLPVWVGASLRRREDMRAAADGAAWRRDDEGENISAKNPNYCELTGLYWAWKNLGADALGVAHYRRHFKGARGVATGDELGRALEGVDAVLPKKRNYFIETNYSQYVHAHHAVDLDETRRILSERYAEYLPAYDSSMKRTSGHRFNMFVMRREAVDRYCTWLFDILFELERRLDISSYSVNDARVFGFVSERLLDVWLETNGIRYAELPVVNLESQHWPRKILAFLKRKFCWG